MTWPFVIYALLCPDCGRPRYVGQACDLKARLRSHLSRSRSEGRYKKSWILSLLAKGKRPGVTVLLRLPEARFLDDAEIFWIAEMKGRGHPLTNLTDGGSGARGHVITPETLKRMSAAKLGKKKSAETRLRMSMAQRLRPRSDEEKAHLRVAMLGKTHSAATLAKMSAAKLGKKKSPETRARMSAAKLGKPLSSMTREKLRRANLGRTHSPATRAKMSLTHNKAPPTSPQTRARASSTKKANHFFTILVRTANSEYR